MKDLTIKEIKRLKVKCELSIDSSLDEFETATGLKVESVDWINLVTPIKTHLGRSNTKIDVRIE